MKRLLIILLALSCTSVSTAQFGKKAAQRAVNKRLNSDEANARIQSLKERTLLVVLSSKNENYNKNIKDAVAEKYTFPNKGIEYKTEKEINKIKKADEHKYALLRLERHRTLAGGSFGGTADYEYDYFISLKLLEDIKSIKKTIWKTSVNKKDPEKLVVLNAVNEINTIIGYKKDAKPIGNDLFSGKSEKELLKYFKKTHQRLSEMTLIIPETLLEGGVNEKFVSAVYPYDFIIVSDEQLDEKVNEEEKEKYAYLTIKDWKASIMDLENGFIMTTPIALRRGVSGDNIDSHARDLRVNKFDMKKLVKYINKFNEKHKK